MFLVFVYQQWNQGESKGLSVWNKTKFLEPMRCKQKKKKKKKKKKNCKIYMIRQCAYVYGIAIISLFKKIIDVVQFSQYVKP